MNIGSRHWFVFIGQHFYLVRTKNGCMKKYLLFFFFAFLLYSCNQQNSPKQAAQELIQALSTADLATASKLVSADTKAVLDKAKKEIKSQQPAAESFQLSTLTETTDGKKAEVRNNLISVPLVKEDGGWKVVLSEALLWEIQEHETLQAAAKTKWEALQKEYEGRMQILKEYINYKKGNGTLSPKMKKLNEAVGKISTPSEWSRENLLAYVQKQQELNNVIDQTLEPSQAANTDLSLNYFLQISNATDRIKTAVADYQAAAAKAHSAPFSPLPHPEAGAKLVRKE